MAAISTALIIQIVIGIVGVVLGFALKGLVQRQRETSKRLETEEHLRQLKHTAERDAENVVKEAKIEAKDLLFQAKSDIERREKDKRAELTAVERKLFQREDTFDRKFSGLEKREEEVRKQEKGLRKRETDIAGQRGGL